MSDDAGASVAEASNDADGGVAEQQQQQRQLGDPSSDDVAAAAAPGAGGEGEEEDDAEDSGFEKTLKSDVATDLSFQLLQQIAAKDPIYHEFKVADLKKLSNALSVLSVKSGDTIIARGEDASFCGIVLDGCFQALVSPTIVVDLRKGALVGEMSLFEGGVRNADILCSEDAVLAVITFAELQDLGTTYPILQRQLYNLFAVASIKKLRKMNMSQEQLLALAKRDEEEAAKNQSVAASGAAAPAAKVPPKSKELLYRDRIARQQERAVAESKKEDEAAAAAEAEKKRLKDEKKARSDKFKFENAQRKVEKYEKMLTQLEEQLEAAQHELNTKDTKIQQLQRAKEDVVAHEAKLHQQLEKEAAARAAVEAKFAKAHEVVSKENDAKFEPIMNALKMENAKLKSEVENANQAMKKTSEDHSKMTDATRVMQESVGELTNVRNNLYQELFEYKKKCEAHEALLNDREKALLEYKFNHRNLESKALEAEEKYQALLPWKTKALEFQQGMELEKKKSARAVEDALKGKQDLEDDIHRYQRILKFVVIGTFCRENKLRKALANVHEHVSDMLLTSMEENINSGTAGSNPNSSSGGMNSSAPFGVGGLHKAPRTSFKAIKKRKKAYLATLLKSKSKPREIVASLDEEVLKLRAPMEEIIDKIKHWRATSESFFSRNIELTAEKEDMEAAFRKTVNKIESIKAILRQNQGEHEELLNRNAELSKINHTLKIEVERLQNKYGIIATQQASDKSAAANASDKDSSGDGGHHGGAGKSGSHRGSHHHKDHKGGVKSPNDSAIEQLQLRQQEVLQVNILRLQQHYNYLISQIQGLNTVLGLPANDGTMLSASNSTAQLTTVVGGDEKQQQQLSPTQQLSQPPQPHTAPAQVFTAPFPPQTTELPPMQVVSYDTVTPTIPHPIYPQYAQTARSPASRQLPGAYGPGSATHRSYPAHGHAADHKVDHQRALYQQAVQSKPHRHATPEEMNAFHTPQPPNSSNTQHRQSTSLLPYTTTNQNPVLLTFKSKRK